MFPFILIAALAFIFYRSATELTDKISFEPAGFNLSKGTLSLKIKNPTETSATVQNVSGSIYANGTRIGFYSVSKAFTIPAFSAATIEVKIDLDKVEVFNQILQLLKKGSTPKISISGSIGTTLGRIAFENTLVEQNNFLKA